MPRKQAREALTTFQCVLDMPKELLLDDHGLRRATQTQAARAHLKIYQMSDAIEILKHETKIEERLPDDDQDRLCTQRTLAMAYRQNGQILQAIETLGHVANIEAKLADNHRGQLDTQHALALAYLDNGHVSQTIKIFERVVKIEQILPEDKVSRLETQHDLAFAYNTGGRRAVAIELLGHVVAVKQKNWPGGHSFRFASESLLSEILEDEDYSGDSMSPQASTEPEMAAKPVTRKASRLIVRFPRESWWHISKLDQHVGEGQACLVGAFRRP